MLQIKYKILRHRFQVYDRRDSRVIIIAKATLKCWANFIYHHDTMCMQILNRLCLYIYGHPYLVAAQEWGGVWYREAKCVSEGAKSNNIPKRTTEMADCCHFPSDPFPPPPGPGGVFIFCNHNGQHSYT